MLDNEAVTTLMDFDHGYLGVAVDRSLNHIFDSGCQGLD